MGKVAEPRKYKLEIVWQNVFIFTVYHILALNGFYFLFTLQLQWKTFVWAAILSVIAGLGMTAGVHRLWSHRAFKAKLPLRLFLALGQTMAFQNHIYEWTRDHRVHHLHADTDADPHNSTRGFFFSHMGWLMVRKLPEVMEAGKVIDLSDLEQDSVVMFQKKYYSILAPLTCLVIPAVVPVYFWNEDFYVSVCIAVLKYLFALHSTWFVNSAAHMWGMRPYDSSIKPVENWYVTMVTYGEGWHNYHHTFPTDYRAAELDQLSGNFTTNFIHLMAKIGWAYDMKTVSDDVVNARRMKTGDQRQHADVVN